MISSATELNLVHLIFIKTRISGAFLKNITTKTRQLFTAQEVFFSLCNPIKDKRDKNISSYHNISG